MRILLDTNIIIYREDFGLVDENLQTLSRLLAENKVDLLVHPMAALDINRDKNEKRRNIIQSKLGNYLKLESPPILEDDSEFRKIIHKKESENEIIDDNLLFCIYRDAVDFLITHDGGIKGKALRLGLQDRVFNIEEAITFFENQKEGEATHVTPFEIRLLPLHNIPIKDSFFDELKTDYPEFSDWYAKKSKSGKKAWVFLNESKEVKAFLMLKEEDETLELSDSTLPQRKRVKILEAKQYL